MPIPALTAIAMLIAVVVIHECSHALVARALGFPLSKVCFGIPLEFRYSLRGKERVVRPFYLGSFLFRGVRIEFSWLLLGGGVVINNEDYAKARLRDKVLVVLYGPLANIICGVGTAMLFLGITKGWSVSYEFVRASIEAVLHVSNGTVPLEQLSSPVGVVHTVTNVIQMDYAQGTLLSWLLLNFSVGVVNLVPLPALDGGQVFMAVLTSFGKIGEKIAFFTTKWCYRFLLAGICVLAARDLFQVFR